MSTTIALVRTVKSKTCSRCGSPFTIDIPANPFGNLLRDMALRRTLCDTCIEEESRQRRIEDRNAKLESEWAKICPPLYCSTDPKRLPRPGLLEKVLKWQFGPTGLLLHGNSGLGKSRCAWLLIRREFEAGRSVGVLNSSAALRYAAAFSRSCNEAERWFNDLSGKDVLFLDDVFKAKISDSFEQALFALIEERTSRMQPIISTCNDTAHTLTARLSSDRGPALVRRLIEFSEDVTFI